MFRYAVTQKFVFALLTAFFLAAPTAFASSHNTNIKNSSSALLEELQHTLSSVMLNIKVTKSISVNTNPNYRIIVPDTCKTAGEADLLQLSKTSPVEESFIFIPKLCIWVESGFDESPVSVRPDIALITHLKSRYNEIIVYHLHVARPDSTEAYFPAYTDLIGLVLLNAHDFYAHKVLIRHRAVTVQGIIEYVFLGTPVSNLIWNKLARLKMQKYAAQNFAYEFSRKEHIEVYYEILRGCGARMSGESKNIELCFPMRFSGFLLTLDGSKKALASAPQR